MKTSGWTKLQVAERIKRLEEAHGGMQELAVELGVAYTTIFRWKSGRAVPTSLAREKIEELEKSVAKKAAVK